MTIDLNLLQKISEDRAIATTLLFGHRHPQADAPMHIEMMDLWRSVNEFVMIEAFREGAKSTKAEESICLEGCFGNFHYALLIGETYEKGCQRLAAIDYESRTNVKLHRLFGGKVLAKKSIENRITFKSGAVIEALGWDQELQSFKQHEHRPDLAWLDDIENRERVRDTPTVDANMRKFWLELVPAMDKIRRRIRFTQTRRAEDCMVTRFAKSAGWLYRGYPICRTPGSDVADVDDPRTASNWPDRYPMAWIRAERDKFAADGMLQEFRQAYLLEVTNPEAKPFKEEMLAAIDVSPWHWMPRYAIYDPARTSRAVRSAAGGASDRYGKVVVSRQGSRILVHESLGAHWKPDEMIEDLFAADRAHSPVAIGIEKNSLDDWLLQPIRIAMLRLGHPIPLKALNAPQDRSKDDFILGLQPFAQAREIVLVGGKVAHPQLVAEWCNFPHGTRDIMNALAYSLRMFAGQAVYPDFSGANIGEAPACARGETVYVGVNASANETVAVAALRDGRRLSVIADWAAVGPDAVKSLVVELRAAFPVGVFSVWTPAEVHDQWQRIPLVPQLRAERITCYRGEHLSVARGNCSTRMRTDWRGKRELVVDRRATLTLNALGSGYAYAVQRGGRQDGAPEEGTSRLAGEALECVVAMLDRDIQAQGVPAGAHVAVSTGGVAYVTARPQRR